MTERQFVDAIARSLHWGYAKDTTGTPAKWSDASSEEREVWRNMARRAIRKTAELTAAVASENAGATPD